MASVLDGALFNHYVPRGTATSEFSRRTQDGPRRGVELRGSAKSGSSNKDFGKDTAEGGCLIASPHGHWGVLEEPRLPGTGKTPGIRESSV